MLENPMEKMSFSLEGAVKRSLKESQWKQPSVHGRMRGKHSVVLPFGGVLLGLVKQGSSDPCCHGDGPGGPCTQ